MLTYIVHYWSLVYLFVWFSFNTSVLSVYLSVGVSHSFLNVKIMYEFCVQVPEHVHQGQLSVRPGLPLYVSWGNLDLHQCFPEIWVLGQYLNFEAILITFYRQLASIFCILCYSTRDEDLDPVGSVDFWSSGSVTFFIGSGSYLEQRIYKVIFIF